MNDIEEGLSFAMYDGFGYGLTIAADGTVEMSSVESHTLLVDDVLDENESYVLVEAEASGTITRDDTEYAMELLFTDGERLTFILYSSNGYSVVLYLH